LVPLYDSGAGLIGVWLGMVTVDTRGEAIGATTLYHTSAVFDVAQYVFDAFVFGSGVAVVGGDSTRCDHVPSV